MSNQSQLSLGEKHLVCLHLFHSTCAYSETQIDLELWVPASHSGQGEAVDTAAFSQGWSQACWSCLSVAPCKHGCSGSRSGASSFSLRLGISAPHLPAQCRHVPGLSSFSSAKYSDKIINLTLLAHILYSKLFVSKSIISTKSLCLNHEK